jgi:hypothetical protein
VGRLKRASISSRPYRKSANLGGAMILLGFEPEPPFEELLFSTPSGGWTKVSRSHAGPKCIPAVSVMTLEFEDYLTGFFSDFFPFETISSYTVANFSKADMNVSCRQTCLASKVVHF